VTQQPGNDPFGEFQRWLVRQGARGVSRELGDQVRNAFGRSSGSNDVWEHATAQHDGESPECAWCPICRAARRLRVSGPGLASHVAAAGDAFSTAVQEVASAVESVIAANRQAGAERMRARPPADEPPGPDARPRPRPVLLTPQPEEPEPQSVWDEAAQAEPAGPQRGSARPDNTGPDAAAGETDQPGSVEPPEGSSGEPDDRD
jgi:hypothetical protein